MLTNNIVSFEQPGPENLNIGTSKIITQDPKICYFAIYLLYFFGYKMELFSF